MASRLAPDSCHGGGVRHPELDELVTPLVLVGMSSKGDNARVGDRYSRPRLLELRDLSPVSWSPDSGVLLLLSIPVLGDPGVGNLSALLLMGVNTRSCPVSVFSSTHIKFWACDASDTFVTVAAAAAANSWWVSSSSSLSWLASEKVFAALVGTNPSPKLLFDAEHTGELEDRGLTSIGVTSCLGFVSAFAPPLERLDIILFIMPGTFSSWLEKEVEDAGDRACGAVVVGAGLIFPAATAAVAVVVPALSSVVRMRLFGLSEDAPMLLPSEGQAAAGLKKVFSEDLSFDGDVIMAGSGLQS